MMCTVLALLLWALPACQCVRPDRPPFGVRPSHSVRLKSRDMMIPPEAVAATDSATLPATPGRSRWEGLGGKVSEGRSPRERPLPSPELLPSTCRAPEEHLRSTCRAPAEHLRSTCGALAEPLRSTCRALAEHLRSTSRALAEHLSSTCRAPVEHHGDSRRSRGARDAPRASAAFFWHSWRAFGAF